MNKVMIVGLEQSGIGDLASVLLSQGFRAALPSLREGKSPEEISSAICKSFQAPDPTVAGTVDFRQLQPGPIWQELATDLILGNEIPGPWLRMDPRSIYLLEFWKHHDPQTLVVLVYGGPESALGHSGSGFPSDFASGTAGQLLDNWDAYNSEMLRFHLANPGCSLLIHGGRARMDPDACARLIGERLASVPDGGKTVPTLSPEENLVEKFIIDRFLEANPRYRGLYEQLQVSAALPLDEPAKVPTSEEALVDHVRRSNDLRDLSEEIRRKELAQEWFNNQLLEVQVALEGNYLSTQGFRWRLREAEKLNAAPHGAADRVRNQLSYRIGSAIVGGSRSIPGVVLMPLVVLIEVCHFAVVSLRRGKKRPPPLKEYADHEEAERVRQQLSYRVGKVLLQNLKSPLGWFRLPGAMADEIKDFKKSRSKEMASGDPTPELK